MYKRKQYIIKRGFQLRYIRLLIFMIAFFIALVIINTYIFMHNNSATFIDVPEAKEVVFSFVLMLVIILIFFGVGVSIYAVLISHSVAGPLYRFEQVLAALSEGNLGIRSNIRKSDELKDFQDVLNNTISKLQYIIKQDKDKSLSLALEVKSIASRLSSNAITQEDLALVAAQLSHIEASLKNTGKFFKV